MSEWGYSGALVCLRKGDTVRHPGMSEDQNLVYV